MVKSPDLFIITPLKMVDDKYFNLFILPDVLKILSKLPDKRPDISVTQVILPVLWV